MRKFLTYIAGAAFALGVAAASANAAVTLTFDGDVAESVSYTESGMNINQAYFSTSGVLIAGGRWNVPCCPELDNDGYEVNIVGGGLFDLLSIDIIHSDSGDPIVFDGYLGAALIASTTINAFNYGSLAFAGFTGLDRVMISVTGQYSDPTFDNLTYQALAVPEPGALALLGLGLAGLAAMRRRRKTA